MIATVLNVHNNPKLVLDTIDSIRTWMTEEILMVVDNAGWKEMSKHEFPAYMVQGFWHNYVKSPYRNIVFGLMQAHLKWPEADWYCYMEPDVLVASDAFKRDLKAAEYYNYWCVGNDARQQTFKLPFLEKIIKDKLADFNYLLGCCVFHKNDFIKKLHEENFFERFLMYTNEFTKGYFPDYEEQGGYDLAEHLFPTLATYYGGKVGGFATWDRHSFKWTKGQSKKYPMRWQPELEFEDSFKEASILHPVKEYDNPHTELSL